MRILCVISALTQGGAEKVMVELSGRWAREHTVDLLTFYPPAYDFFCPDPGVRRGDLGLGRRRFWDLAAQFRLLAGIRRRAVEFKPDAVVSFVAKTNVYVLAALSGTGFPVVACEHSIIDRKDIPLPVRLLRRFLYPRAYRVGVLTESAGKELVRCCPGVADERIAVLPNAIFPAAPVDPVVRQRTREAYGIPQDAFWAISLGRFHPVKRFDLLIDAAARPESQGISYTVFGGGALRDELLRDLARSPASSRLSFPGPVASSAEVLSAADLFVSTSVFEGFPMAVAEALAAGLPVVAFDVPGVRDVVRDGVNGLLVPFGDSAALAEAIARLRDDAPLRERLGRAAAGIAETYSPENIDKIWFKSVFGGLPCASR